MHEKKFDEAVVRFYRCLEGIIQYQLRKYSIDTSHPTLSSIGETEVEKFLEMIGKKSLPENLSLFEGYLLLKDILKDKFTQKIDFDRIRGLMFARNHSILAHGTQVIKRETAMKFYKNIEHIIRLLFEEENINFQKTSEDGRFLEIAREEFYLIMAPL